MLWLSHTECRKGEIYPSLVIMHEMKLEQAPEVYEMFREDGCIKVVLKP